MSYQLLESRNRAAPAASDTIEQLAVVHDDRRQAGKAAVTFRGPNVSQPHGSFEHLHNPHNEGNCPHLSTGNCPRDIFTDLREDARMSKAQEIAARAAELAVQRNLTEREASIDATGKPDLIRDMRRGRMPSGERLDALAATLNTTVDFLLGKVTSSVPPGGDADIPIDRLPQDVPVYGTALGADLQINDGDVVLHVERTIVELTDVAYYIRRMPGIAGDREAYGLTVVGMSMAPRYEDGDPIYVSPRKQPAIGDYVVVQMNGEGSGEVISALVKRLVGRTSEAYELEQFNPPMRFKVLRASVARIHRVVPPRELAG